MKIYFIISKINTEVTIIKITYTFYKGLNKIKSIKNMKFQFCHNTNYDFNK